MLIIRPWRILVMTVAAGVTCGGANAAVMVIGGQYQEDDVLPEYRCIWHDDCHHDIPGSNVHVYLKNSGPSPVTITDVTLAGYSLATVLKENTSQHNARSIYYYWDNPPAGILNAGDPVWYKADPSVIPAGGVAQVVVRLRRVPVTKPVSIGVVTTGGTVATAVPVNAGDPALASVSFSSDRKKVYLSWRRDGGAAPATIRMDDVDVTASASTVGDPTVNYAVSVLSFDTPLANMSYHVYQGVYTDGKTATASLRTWVNPFVHGCWAAKSGEDGDLAAARAYIDDATNRGINAMIVNGSNIINDLLGTASGRQYCADRGFGFVIDSVNKWNITTPLLWFLNDEPDAEEDNVSHTFCGTGLRLPCGGNPMGIIAQDLIALGENFRASSPSTPTTVNLDGTFKPSNYYTWGQTVDVLMADPYYQRRLQDAYWRDQEQIPLYEKATYIYAVSKALAKAAEPNPAISALYLCSWRCDAGKCDEQYVGMVWPFPTPASKRIEAYYALGAGVKGLAYWWFKQGYPSNGIDAGTPAALALWKEMGLYGVEIKTIAPLLVTSHPVDMTLAPSTNVWARALASGTDTVILLAVNDNYYNDFAGCHYTPVSNASVTATLPSWMTSSPTAFEIRPSGLHEVNASLAGSNLTVSLGTLNLTRMIVVTTNPTLRATIQQRYEQEVWPGVCAFAPEHCLPQQNRPSIVEHPSNRMVGPGGSTSFTVVAAGSSPLSYQWQKNNADLLDGGHYADCTKATLKVSSADVNDVAAYRCVVTNPHGTATSDAATLTLGAPTGPIITQHPSNESVAPGGTVSFEVDVEGTPPLSYQWQKNQSDLDDGGHYSGCTTAKLTITAADENDAANYRCVITNDLGPATSDEAVLTVAACSAPTLLNGGFEGGSIGGIGNDWVGYTRPAVPATLVYSIQSALPPEGIQYQQVQTSYVASGGAGVYQVVPKCASGASYTISGWMRTNSANGRATVRCAPDGSTSYSSAVDLTPPATTTSNTWVAFSGTVTATASSIVVFLDGQTHVVGSTAKAVAFDGLSLTGPAGSPPTITEHPLPQDIATGGSADFTVTANGDESLSYRWQRNSTDITDGGHYSGATTATLTVSNADSSHAGNYRCVVTGGCGGVTSNPAALTVAAATVPGDFDLDGDVDQADFGHMQHCLDSVAVPADPSCTDANLDQDPTGAVTQEDVLVFLDCVTGPGVLGDPNCAN